VKFSLLDAGSRSASGSKSQNVARLARERPADRIECRKADRARLAGFEDREVGQRHSDPIRELGQRHPPIVKQVVKLDGCLARRSEKLLFGGFRSLAGSESCFPMAGLVPIRTSAACGWLGWCGRGRPHSGFDVSHPDDGKNFLPETLFVRSKGIPFSRSFLCGGKGALHLAEALARANQVSGTRRMS
jgi:hypothetical protein